MTEFEFQSRNTGTLLRGRLVEPASANDSYPIVVMLTGDGPKGSKSLSWVNMPPLLAEVGVASFMFDFEGLGHSDGDRSKLSVSVGIDNFRTAYDFIRNQLDVDDGRLGAFASSFGAEVLLLTPDIANGMGAIGLKSPAAFIADAYFNEIGSDKFDAWREEGFLEDNGYSFEVFLDSLSHNAFLSAREIETPCLITQGSADEIIPWQHTRYLYECLKSGDKRLEIFEGAGHGYSEGDSWETMANMFVSWFKTRLGNERR